MSYSVIHGVDSNKDPVAIQVDSHGKLQLSPTSSFYAEVNTWANLPSAGDHTTEIQIVLVGTGIYPFNRKDSGMWQSDGAKWNHLGQVPSYFLDSNFKVGNVTDNTKLLGYDLSGITTGTTRTHTIQDQDGTVALLSDVEAVDLNTLADVNTPAVTNGQIPVWDNDNGYFDFTYNINDTKVTGFIDTADSNISFVNGTRTFTISPAISEFSYYSESKKYTKTASENIIISDVSGLHFIYYDGDTLKETTTFTIDLLSKYAFVSEIYWVQADARQILFADERHGCVMSSRDHEYLHKTRGAVLEITDSYPSGLSGILSDENGSLDSHAQFSNLATILWDEDISFLFGSRASTSNISLYYRAGVDSPSNWVNIETASFGVVTTGTGRAAWNELTGGSWQLAEITNNDFVLAHVFVINDDTREYAVFMGQAGYGTLNNARVGAEIELQNLKLNGIPTLEFRPIASIIYQTSNSYTNTVKSRIRSISAGVDYVDWTGELSPGSGTSGVSTYLGLTDTPNSYIGEAGKIPVVNSGGTALEFYTGITFNSGNINVNPLGADQDFILEGVTDSNLFVCDAGLDTVAIGKTPSATYKLEIADDVGVGRNLVFNTDNAGSANTVNTDIQCINSDGDAEIVLRANNSSGSIVYGQFAVGNYNQLTFNLAQGYIESTIDTTAYNYNTSFKDRNFIWNANSSGVAMKYDSGTKEWTWTGSRFDFVSTTGALLVPRMTTTQRDAFSGVNGMIIYNTTTNAFNWRANGAWVAP